MANKAEKDEKKVEKAGKCDIPGKVKKLAKKFPKKDSDLAGE